MGPTRGVIVVVIVGGRGTGELTWHTDSCEMCAGWSFGQHLIHSTGLCSVRFGSVRSALVWFGLVWSWFGSVTFSSVPFSVLCPVSCPVLSCDVLFGCSFLVRRPPLPLGSPPRVLANWPSGNEHNNISASSNNNKHVEDREEERESERGKTNQQRWAQMAAAITTLSSLFRWANNTHTLTLGGLGWAGESHPNPVPEPCSQGWSWCWCCSRFDKLCQ